MTAPTLCMIFEAIGPYSSIAKVAYGEVQLALKAGWKVTVVAKLLHESLQGQVEWLRLYVPPRGFFIQWITARFFIKKALGKRTFDVVHAHQPQAADLSDVFQCHFLTRRAYETETLESRPGLRPAFIRLQQQGVLYAEDYFYKRWNNRTHMIFVSQMLCREFQRLYGLPLHQEVLVNPMPPCRIPSESERREAKKKFTGQQSDTMVLGYLGGLHRRKGFESLLNALEGQEQIFLLMGGPYTEGFETPKLKGHFRSVGLVKNIDEFFAACNVFIVPSLFDPCPLVVFEAISRGIPVIATEGVGNLSEVLEYKMGAMWSPSEPLAPLVESLSSRRTEYQINAPRMVDALGAEHYARCLLNRYENVLNAKM